MYTAVSKLNSFGTNNEVGNCEPKRVGFEFEFFQVPTEKTILNANCHYR